MAKEDTLTVEAAVNSSNNINNNNKVDERKKAKQQKKKEQKKRQKQKKIDTQQHQQLHQQHTNGATTATTTTTTSTTNGQTNNNDDIHMVDEHHITTADDDIIIDESDPSFELYAKLLKHFDNPTGYEEPKVDEEEQAESKQVDEPVDQEDANGEQQNDNDGEESAEVDASKPKKMSNRERKRQQKLNLPILKQLVDRPDIVELHDTNSPNPAFLIALKGCRNSVQVPTHWNVKRKYLQGKRGYVKTPFELPEFIAATGITKIREALLEKQAQQKTKTKQRERLQPKMRSMNIDYEVLRDAFFIHQTKPKLTIQGQLYYEGKEFEVAIKKTKPGVLSEELRRALGMPDGYPPPWLIHMQQHGPPPSYPNLKVPGVNAPIPEGAQYGIHPGEWGRPPADLAAQYASTSSTSNANIDALTNPVEREHWGQLLPEEEVEEEEETEQQENEEDDEQAVQPPQPNDMEINEGISSVPSGLETPDTIDIKKSKFVDGGQPRQLYQVLEQSNRSLGSGMMESNYKYNVPAPTAATSRTSTSKSNKVDLIKSHRTAPVDITLNPSEMEDMDGLDEELLKKKFDQAMAEKRGGVRPREDDLIDDSKKRKSTGSSKDDKTKKFKF
ncbi:hypothetical protein SAMD00019534_077310 [Acytostelium subglobosum LB1]|uniref:hypothetical protein n=1 Tax=Acytostelium subglobosum LB1 TaxID=1410327 RepID=UPI0006450692|nr:hypothetical protein SAMD00019534_077310 [Acytostelium subglobosum LB1]GAM24556.1 hypothetical protein SAMD00019534_077310 [Acytostelium subglobosum LB1]|eukprot:XP_012752225.1 hypothetical protein SAMD00019534_077310 [Acytostelium subglobosum LB1]